MIKDIADKTGLSIDEVKNILAEEDDRIIKRNDIDRLINAISFINPTAGDFERRDDVLLKYGKKEIVDMLHDELARQRMLIADGRMKSVVINELLESIQIGNLDKTFGEIDND